MNQHLQDQLGTLLRSGHLSADEKNVLEQTIKTVEVQSRELEIEAALERVRARAMSMQNSDELKELIGTVFTELTKLDVVLTRCLIMIYEPETDSSTWWMANSEAPADPIGLYVKKHEHKPYLAYLKAWKERNLKWHYLLEAQDKTGWDNFLFVETELAQLPAPVIAGMKAPGKVHLSASFNNFGNLTLATLEALSEEHFDILLRFAKVFDLTYTRFNDLQKAESQAREAQIELALERVRAKTMAMHNSEDVADTVATMFDELLKLGIQTIRCGIGIMQEAGKMEVWTAKPADNARVELIIGTLDMGAHPLLQGAYHGWQNKEISFSYELKDDDLVSYYNAINNDPGYPIKYDIASLPSPIFHNDFYFPEGTVYTFSLQQFPAAVRQVFKRFAAVFGQTYRRFLDLQKAETQAREAQIEASLERVRAKAMAMHDSGELDEVLAVMFDQFDILGIESVSTHMTLIDLENNTFTFRETGKAGHRSYGEQTVAIDSMDTWKDAAQKWRNSEPLTINSLHFPKEILPQVWQIFHESFASMPENAKIYPEDYPDGIYHTAGNCKFGYIGMNQTRKATEEEEQIVIKFATEFGRLYQRFLDLQKAEAQAREAKIEAALERVRSTAMSMQKSENLAHAVAIVFEELDKLNLGMLRCGIGILNKNKCSADVWTTTKSENETVVQVAGDEPMNIHPLLQNAFDAWVNKKEDYAYVLQGKDLTDFYKALAGTNFKLPDSQLVISDTPDYKQYYYVVTFQSGALYAFRETEFPAEAKTIMKRFADVFDFTYTRFNDLKQAEAQAKEAKIEVALERVRSRTLAMQKSYELAETAVVLFKQLINLGIEPNRLYIGIVKDESGDMEMWATDEDVTAVGTKFIFNKNDNDSVRKLYDGWAAKNKSLVIDMQEKELEDYFHYLGKVIPAPFKAGLSQKRRGQHVAYFSRGFIGMASPDEQSQEAIHLLERFAAVFNLTFTRFNDLKIAEAHAEQAQLDLIQLQTEKKRAEDALTELRTTQTQLVQSEKMASLGELTAGIAHEIQNPLNFVNNFSDVSNELLQEMKEELEKGNYKDAMAIANDVMQNLEKITHHGKRADGIVKGMLQHSRASSATKEPTDINKLADEYLRLAYHGLRAKDKTFNASMKTDYDDRIGTISIIPQDMGRVILNLITNAFYAVAEKKKQTTAMYEPTVSVITKKETGKVFISVKDNGNGIPQKVLDKIFQPFFTTKPTGQGTGLGLSLSYDIVKAHGGQLHVDTAEGQGSEFFIQLPIT